MNTKNNNVTSLSAAKHRDNSQHPIRFDHLHPGSLFRIISEPSRGIAKSHDNRIYRKDLVGFHAALADDADHAAVLFPYDKVMPVVLLRDGQKPRNSGKPQAR